MPDLPQDSIFTLNRESDIDQFLHSNHKWVNSMNSAHPVLFDQYNGKGQDPHTLLISCSDSRYNENCFGVLPGEIFTLKTVANICHADDLSLLATIEFAVLQLKVSKIIILGHTDCGGIKTCLTNKRKDLPSQNCGHLFKYLTELDTLVNDVNKKNENNFVDLPIEEKSKILSIKNVENQFNNINTIDTVKEGISNSTLQVFGMLYNVNTGLIEKCV
ncbi:hypothetical protein TPHA_0C03320 [Tetrapisispora phaffii CBS 4417]|uniref:Carbonic anhydrase n=1 Tax=Tetrapisispora phaffii (strain ATCC 24235 / CBS 4417 / NBRC 1672 / NRRL Y-8282 / UCD 70-5) TaxID=1071381 RepID=G8BRV8_TETPH|nr:hypothetical protein TPHA_0C03320 [Tetrapisispora phaffii CBS 4417]CCE62484.1 hypothetical protein TPHA_0C03320 [Tetrapisispora phaffii CBS 4417]